MNEGEFTELLVASRSGDQVAWSSLVRLVYTDLQRLARRQRSHNAIPTTLGTTGLVHESYMRLAGTGKDHIENRKHFLNLASRIMRQVLCDYARLRLRDKRGGGVKHEELTDIEVEEQSEAQNLIWIDELLTKLEAENPTWARVVECRFFTGLTDDETAEALGLTLRTAQRNWHDARKWLADHLE
ncbi:ECF-type sigma factor [Agrilutibacter solisilvae]|uniref:RNA polymerase subunit sigma n=1 Tax=Agrilutibacter solisilvae TaxID=2763317 RepID=A0A974XX91_9GAMM|nr:ECF-type sigma factor [Lysobacter solisilvae]QSX77511.1 RNA polymerase subunit sigma [Lysobacter solisilvae]